MKFIDLFAGAGGFSLGFEKAGFINQGFVEIWKPAIDTIQLNTSNKLINTDIKRIKKEDLKGIEADLIIGGPPCQGFSMAGKRDKNDDRNYLFLEYLRIVDIIKPKICILENVKGITTMKDKEGNLIIRNIISQFEKRGYKVYIKLMNSFNYQVPQKRERIIIIASNLENNNKKEYYPQPIKQKVYLDQVLTLPYEEQEKQQHIYHKHLGTQKKSFYLKNGDNLSSFGSAGIKLRQQYAPTITKTGKYIHPTFNRFLSVREVARIQTFPDTYKFCGNLEQMYGLIGNAVPVNMAYEIAKQIKKIVVKGC